MPRPECYGIIEACGELYRNELEFRVSGLIGAIV